MFRHELGIVASDRITGFKGRITSRIDHVTGCSQYYLQPSVNPAKMDVMPEGRWIDENRVQIEDATPLVLETEPDAAGRRMAGACATHPGK